MVVVILLLAGALVGGCFDVRVGLVSFELFFRDAVLLAVDVGLGAPERSRRIGEVSREAKGEDLEVDVCVAGWDGGLLISPFNVEAADDSRLWRAGAVMLALASVEPDALLVVVSILTTRFLDSCRRAFEGGSALGRWVT